ncbi:class I SAM-dependent methyltransferase [Candidatus Woesearchaeota archaeon]|nr:class I SAM-dependent methyltransferase [Candidatus Woesearchaeota archaeon]
MTGYIALGEDTAAHRSRVIWDEMIRFRGFGYELKTFFQGINLDDVLKPGSVVLDMGCGYGNTLSDMLRKFDIEAHGIDFKKYRGILPYLAQLFGQHKKIKFTAGDFEQLPYRDGSFDFVFSYMAIPYTRDKLQAVREAHRVLRIGGVGVLEIEMLDGYGPQIRPLLMRLWKAATMVGRFKSEACKPHHYGLLGLEIT